MLIVVGGLPPYLSSSGASRPVRRDSDTRVGASRFSAGLGEAGPGGGRGGGAGARGGSGPQLRKGRDLPRPQQVDKLGDKGARQSRDLIQVDCAVGRELEAPEPPSDRQGRRFLLVAE